MGCGSSALLRAGSVAFSMFVLANATVAQSVLTSESFDYGVTGVSRVPLHARDGGVGWKGPWMGVGVEGLASWWPLDNTSADVGPFGADGILSNGVYSIDAPASAVWSTHSLTLDPSQSTEISLTPHVSKYAHLMRGSITAWVKSGAASIEMVVFGGANSRTRNKLALMISSGVVFWDVQGELPSSGAIRGVKKLANGAWHHIAVTVESDGFAKIYADGKLDGEGHQGFFGSVFDLNGLWIGRNEFYGPWGHFKGQIDDVAVWGSVLSEAEIQQLASLPPPLVSVSSSENGPNLESANLSSPAFGTLGFAAVGNRVSDASGHPAARRLGTKVNLSGIGQYYVSCLMRTSGAAGGGCQIELTDSFGVGCRFGWNEQRLWTAGLMRVTTGPVMLPSTTYFVVLKVNAGFSDRTFLKVYGPGEAVHPDDSVLNGMGTGANQWTIVHLTEFIANVLDTLWIQQSGTPGSVEVDELRIGQTWESVTSLGYGTGCLGTSIGRSGRPATGISFAAHLNGASPSRPAFLILGRSRDLWGALSLPFELSSIGAPGCSVLASIDLTLSAATDPTGSATTNLTIPNLPSLLGAVMYLQWASIDAVGTNPLPLAFSNAMEAVIEGT